MHLLAVFLMYLLFCLLVRYQAEAGNGSLPPTACPYITNDIKGQQWVIEEKEAQIQTLVDELKALQKELEDLRKELPAKKAVAGNWSFSKFSLSQNVPNPYARSTVIRYQIPAEYR
jgi:cell division protein FtsB